MLLRLEPLYTDMLRGNGNGGRKRTGLGSRAGGCGSLHGDLDKLVNVLGATPATIIAFEIEFGLELAGHHESSASGLADFRLRNSIAQTHIHRLLFVTIMRSILSIDSARSFVNPSRAAE